MNIFALDSDPIKAAKYHCDKHVVKMITETAQILSTVHHELKTKNIDIDKIYKLTHINNPCSNWVKRSLSNYNWLVTLGLELGKEYTYRYGKIHKTQDVLTYLNNVKPVIDDGGLSKFVMVMPDEFKINSDPILSYRNFYNKDKSKFAKWRYSETPFWFKNENNSSG